MSDEKYNKKDLYVYLNNLKQEDKTLYDQLTNVLEFIYKDVNNNYYDKTIDHLEIKLEILEAAGTTSYSTRSKKTEIEIERKNMYRKIESKEGIVPILMQLCQEEDKRFINKFFDSVNVPIDMLRKGIIPNMHLYIENINIMLTAYRYNRGIYENFEAIINDLNDNFTELQENFNLASLSTTHQNLIIDCVYNPRYCKNENLRQFIKEILLNPSMVRNRKLNYNIQVLNTCRNLYFDMINLNSDNNSVDDEKIQLIENDIIEKANLNKNVYYDKLLLVGERYQFINDKLNEIEENDNFKQEIFNHICALPNIFYNKLNDETGKDAFIEVMRNIFDSDTYKELINKLIAVQSYAGWQFIGGSVNLKELTEELSTRKDYINDTIPVQWSQDSNNKIEKPKTIIERTIKLYQKLGGLSEIPECLSKYKHGQFTNIDEFLQALTFELEEKKQTDESEVELKKAKGLGKIFKKNK